MNHTALDICQTWGQERIANERWLKLGLQVSPRTVRKYMPNHCVGGPGKRCSSQRWSTFMSLYILDTDHLSFTAMGILR